MLKRLLWPLAGLTRDAATSRLRRHGRRRRDVDEMLRLARLSFVGFQAAWDRADLETLSRLASAPLLADLRRQLAERGSAPNHTEVLTLEARLLDTDDLGGAWVASVEFSGLIREGCDATPTPFRELWLLACPKAAGTHWRLAQVQSLS